MPRTLKIESADGQYRDSGICATGLQNWNNVSTMFWFHFPPEVRLRCEGLRAVSKGLYALGFRRTEGSRRDALGGRSSFLLGVEAKPNTGVETHLDPEMVPETVPQSGAKPNRP